MPGCKRTIPRDDREDEVCICSVHWRFVPAEWRGIWRRRKRAMIRQRDANDAIFATGSLVESREIEAEIILRRVTARLWRRMAREAIEKAVGLG